MRYQELTLKYGVRVLAPVPGVAFTGRLGGVSSGPFHALNVGIASGDDPLAVLENRRRISEALGITAAWEAVRQVHGCSVREVPARGGNPDAHPPAAPMEADAIVVRNGGTPAMVLAADCLPVALTGDGVAVAIHAGWRGLCRGVIESAASQARRRPPSGAGQGVAALTAWLGPCIGPCCFEVGPEVADAFGKGHPEAPAFSGMRAGRRYFDLPAAAAWVLAQSGVTLGGISGACTACDPSYFSHRRDASGRRVTGRQALITWIPGADLDGPSQLAGQVPS